MSPNLIHSLDQQFLINNRLIGPNAVIKEHTTMKIKPLKYLDAPKPVAEEPLLPYETREVQYLLNQMNAASARVRLAVLNHPKLLVS